MKKLQLKNDDYLGYVKNLRHACRGIVVNDGKVLLGYEVNYNKYIIPGGGLEEGEKEDGCTFKWIPMEDDLDIFGRYEDFHKTNIADYGLYRREYYALSVFSKR